MTRTETTTSTSTSAEGSEERKCDDRASPLRRSQNRTAGSTRVNRRGAFFRKMRFRRVFDDDAKNCSSDKREWIVLLNRIAERRNMVRGHALAISLPACCRHFHIFENWGGGGTLIRFRRRTGLAHRRGFYRTTTRFVENRSGY